MKKPKILYVGPEEGDHLYNWIRPLRDRYEIHTATLHPDVDMPGVHHHRLRRRAGSRLDFWLARAELRRLIQELQPDIIHAHYLSSYGLMVSGLQGNTPLFLSIWGSDVNKSDKNPLMRFFCARAARGFDYINSPSENIGKTLQRWGVSPEKVEVYQYGVDTTQLPLRPPRPASTPLKLISFRDWAPLYRVESIIRGFHAAFASDTSLELVLIGRRTEEQERRIRAEVEAGPGREQIRILSFVPRTELLQMLTQMDVFFSVPTMDGMPLSLLEGLAIGLVPVVSAIPANREWLENENLPWVEEAAPAEMAEAILKARELLQDQAGIERRRKKVFEQGDTTKNLNRLIQAYEQNLKSTSIS